MGWMRVYVELPEGWGPGQVIITAWIRAGYRVQEQRSVATGARFLVVRGAGEAELTRPVDRR